MEGPQPQKETARGESITDKPGRVMDLFWIFGGVVFIVLSSYILMGLTYVVDSLEYFIFRATDLWVGGFTSFLFCSGLTALFMVAVYLILPVRMDRMRDALVQGAGLALFAYPIMIVKDPQVIIAIIGPIHGPYLGIETPYWPIYSSLGLLLLLQPWLKRVGLPRGLPHPFLTALGLCLGLLSMVWTLFLIFRSVIYGTYSAVLITSSLVVIVFTSMYAIHPKGPEIKSAPPHSYEWQRSESIEERPQGERMISSPLSRLVLWLVTVYSPAVLVGVDSGVATVIISAPLWTFAASEGTGIIWVFLGLVSRPDLVPVIVLSILATCILMTFPVLLPTIMLELVPRRRDWLEYAGFMILVHPAFILFIEVFFLATGATALVVPVPLAALVQYRRYRQLHVTLRGVSRGMLVASPTA